MACYHRKYLLKCEQYDEVWQRSRGRCALCGKRPEDDQVRQHPIDHDGYVGRWAVRGLLCQRCNTGFHWPRVVPVDVAEHYAANSWYRSLSEPMHQPEEAGALVVGRWSEQWRRDKNGLWSGKSWKQVLQVSGPYLMPGTVEARFALNAARRSYPLGQVCTALRDAL